jgi:hypothetical protein
MVCSEAPKQSGKKWLSFEKREMEKWPFYQPDLKIPGVIKGRYLENVLMK